MYDEETKTLLTTEFVSFEKRRGLKIVMQTARDDLSEFSLDLPLNFMGKKNGGGWQNQYLLNSPYSSANDAYKYCYLTNPNGRNLILFPKGKCDGWKCNYSSDYCPGHFFVSLEFMPSFDKVYGRTVKILHDDGYVTSYSALERIESNITVGTNLERGDVIGAIGTSVRAFPEPALLFSLEQNSVSLDPELLTQF